MDNVDRVQEHSGVAEVELPGLPLMSASPVQSKVTRTPDQEVALIARVCAGETQLF